MKSFLIRQAYTLLILLAYPWVKKRLAKETKTPEEWSQRAGIIADFSQYQVTWLHCASVGEVNAALPLIRQLNKYYPKELLVITTMTATGAARIKSQVPKAIHLFLPLDLPWYTQRFISQLKPRLGVIFETEIWPNLLHSCKAANIPLVQANARITPKAYSQYLRVKSLFAVSLKSLSYLIAKSAEDAQRFVELGLDEDKVIVAGNIKYDLDLNEEFYIQVEKKQQYLANKGFEFEERNIWLAASTHAEEEIQVLSAHKQVLASMPNTLLIIAPRHPERFNQVAELIQLEGLSFIRHSNKEVTPEEVSQAQVYLLDTLGELTNFYPLAKLAFIGGSLVPKGGHNVLEAAALGIPIITGPYTQDFAEIIQDLKLVDALTEVLTPNQLIEAVKMLLMNTENAQRKAQAGLQLVASNKGSLAKHLEIIDQLLKED